MLIANWSVQNMTPDVIPLEMALCYCFVKESLKKNTTNI